MRFFPVVNGYELLDFGDGRKLERLGGVVLDRPCPAAGGAPRVPCGQWQPDARFVEARPPARGAAHRWRYGGSGSMPARRGSMGRKAAVCRGFAGRWQCLAPLPEQWHVYCGGVRLGLRLAASGQVGLFPEHAAYWPWIAEQIEQAGREVRVLNLFAYTGGATLAAAAAGAQVVHVDAARGAVHWARRNAEQAGLAKAAIRWIVDDCRAFVARELRRGRNQARPIRHRSHPTNPHHVAPGVGRNRPVCTAFKRQTGPQISTMITVIVMDSWR